MVCVAYDFNEMKIAAVTYLMHTGLEVMVVLSVEMLHKTSDCPEWVIVILSTS
jgi:hypothetical protein